MNENIKDPNDNLDTPKNKIKESIQFFFTYLMLFVYLYFFATILKKFASNQLNNLIISIILYIPVLIYIYISAKKRNISSNDMGLTKDGINIVVILLFIYVGLFIYKGEYTSDNIIEWLFFLICTGITEELIFRGYIYERSKHFMSRKQSIFWNCLLFTFVHISPQMVLQGLTVKGIILYLQHNLVGFSFLSVIFIIIKEKTNTIWIPVVLHSIVNFL